VMSRFTLRWPAPESQCKSIYASPMPSTQARNLHLSRSASDGSACHSCLSTGSDHCGEIQRHGGSRYSQQPHEGLLRHLVHGYDWEVRNGYPRFSRIPSSTKTLWLLGLQFAPAMIAKKPTVPQTEGLGKKPFHGRVVLLVNRHTASAAEMIVALARENNLARIVGEKTAGRSLSATSVKVGKGFRFSIISPALPSGFSLLASSAILRDQ
jgi:Peptidase family S41